MKICLSIEVEFYKISNVEKCSMIYLANLKKRVYNNCIILVAKGKLKLLF